MIITNDNYGKILMLVIQLMEGLHEMPLSTVLLRKKFNSLQMF